ncbi:MAG: hypothetical protein JWO78_1927 [Micavibrio sp.]|nr:hypothetical protein [Micavibrio sp.]
MVKSIMTDQNLNEDLKFYFSSFQHMKTMLHDHLGGLNLEQKGQQHIAELPYAYQIIAAENKFNEPKTYGYFRGRVIPVRFTAEGGNEFESLSALAAAVMSEFVTGSGMIALHQPKQGQGLLEHKPYCDIGQLDPAHNEDDPNLISLKTVWYDRSMGTIKQLSSACHDSHLLDPVFIP